MRAVALTRGARRGRANRGAGVGGLPLHGSQPDPGAATWRVGDRVLAGWLDDYLYPATVAAVQAGGYLVRYDDSGQLVVPGARLRPIVVEPGEQIFIRPRGEARLMYYPAVVLRVAGESLDVRFEA